MALTSLDVLQKSGTLNGAHRAPTEPKKDLDKDAFLKILVAQLTYQDPLNPMDDKDFVAQLAQFSSLEQLTNISGSMETMIGQQAQSAIGDAVGLIGKEVSASGYTLAKEGSSVSTLHYYCGADIESGFLNIYDQDNNLRYTEILGPKQGDTLHKFVWNGRDYNGDILPDGIYSVGIAGEDADGNPVYIQMEVTGKVEGVVTDNGKIYLVLEDGRYVDYNLVGEISQGRKIAEAPGTADTPGTPDTPTTPDPDPDPEPDADPDE